MRPPRPWGAAICETVATFVGSWEGKQSDVLPESEEASPSLEGANWETVAAFVGSWEAQQSDVLRGPT